MLDFSSSEIMMYAIYANISMLGIGIFFTYKFGIGKDAILKSLPRIIVLVATYNMLLFYVAKDLSKDTTNKSEISYTIYEMMGIDREYVC